MSRAATSAGSSATWSVLAAGTSAGAQANIVELYISYLRRKIDKGREPMIHTMRGVGYVLKPAAGTDERS